MFTNENISMTVEYTNDMGFPATDTVSANELFTLEYYNNDITVTSLDGSVIGTISFTDSEGLPVEYSPVSNEFNFSIYVAWGDETHYDINIASSEPATPNISGFTHLYSVDYSILKEIAGVRYTSVPNTDLGNFIIDVIEFPFNFDDLIAGNNPIHLGGAVLEIQGAELHSDVLEISLGEINVTGDYNNSYDYLNTVTNLYLPYVDMITLETDLVMNETISITYVVNLYTGDSTVNIHSSKTNNIIHSESVTIGRKIPFKNVDYPIINGINNKILTPFIEVVRNEPIQNKFTNNIIESGLMNQFTGYVEVTNIDLKSESTLTEKRNIISLLRNGVFIND